MRDESRGIEAAGPPWSVDLLADLHAGVLDEAQAAQLWPRVNADPEARAIIEALEATKVDLAALATAPVPPMPADVAARIDTALANETQQAFGMAPVVSIDVARRRRNKRIGWITGVVAVAAAAIAAVAIVIPKTANTNGTPVAQPPSAGSSQAPALALRSDNPDAALGQLTPGVKDYGPLGNAEKLNTCLRAAGFTAQANPISVRPGTIDGQPAVFALLTTGTTARFRLVGLSPSCGVANAGVLLDKVIGK